MKGIEYNVYPKYRFGILYFAYSIVFTMNDMAYWGMVPALARQAQDRNRLTSRTVFFAGVGQFLAGHSFSPCLNFVSVTLSMGILFPLLRRIKVTTLWSSFFLSFMWFVNCILGILSFWANIHSFGSAYHV